MKESIKKYINNDLSEIEETLLEHEIMNNGFDFIERRKAWQNLMSPVFEEIENEEKPILRVTQKSAKRFYLQAASLVGLIAVSAWLLYRTTSLPVPTPQIVAEHTNPQTLLDATIDGIKLGNETRKGENDAAGGYEADFKAGKFARVIESLKQLGSQRSIDQTYYLAVAYLKVNPKDFEAAQPLLKMVAEDKNTPYHTDALWLYALIAIKQNQFSTARTALEKISMDSKVHGLKAQKLLKKLPTE